MDAAELQEARASVDQLLEGARVFVNAPIPVGPEERRQYAVEAANFRERLQGAGMSAFVLDEQNGYRLAEINNLTSCVDSVSRYLDESRKPQLSEDAAKLPAPGADTPETSVKL
jgi:hypothetical protein